MEAKDFRIGNLIYKSIKSGKGRTIIDKIGCQDLVRIHENIGSFNYEPIGLTEEFLEKNGFEYDQDTNRFDLLFSLTNYDFCFSIDTHDNEFFYFINGRRLFIVSVHQLQNLFYSLTGEELPIK